MESLTRPAHRRKLSNANGVFSFSSKSTYDDVFAAPPPATTAAASAATAKMFKAKVGVEEYGEIFGGDSRGSSIPVLDLSALDDERRTGSEDHLSCSKKLDYAKIFGGFPDEDIAVPYEELFSAKGKKCASGKAAMNQSVKVSPLRGPDSCSLSGRNNGHSSELSDQSLDGVKQVNMSYHKSSPRSKDGASGTMHIAKLHAVPGFTYFIDETARQQKTEGDKPASLPVPLPVTSRRSDVQRTWSFSGNIHEGNNGRKTEMPMANTLNSEGVIKAKRGSWRDGSRSNDKLFNSGEIDLESQSFESSPSSSPPAKRDDSKGHPKRSKSLNFASKANAFEKAGDYLTSSSDEELDMNSAAAASVAALKKAIEQAQERIRLAKELMERKKDGFQGYSKPSTKGKSRKGSRVQREANNIKENNAKETCERLNDVLQEFTGRNKKATLRTDEVATASEHSEKLSASIKVEMEKHQKDVVKIHGETTRFSDLGNKRNHWTTALASRQIGNKNTMKDKQACDFGEMKTSEETSESIKTSIEKAKANERDIGLGNAENRTDVQQKAPESNETVNKSDSACMLHEYGVRNDLKITQEDILTEEIRKRFDESECGKMFQDCLDITKEEKLEYPRLENDFMPKESQKLLEKEPHETLQREHIEKEPENVHVKEEENENTIGNNCSEVGGTVQEDAYLFVKKDDKPIGVLGSISYGKAHEDIQEGEDSERLDFIQGRDIDQMVVIHAHNGQETQRMSEEKLKEEKIKELDLKEMEEHGEKHKKILMEEDGGEEVQRRQEETYTNVEADQKIPGEDSEWEVVCKRTKEPYVNETTESLWIEADKSSEDQKAEVMQETEEAESVHLQGDNFDNNQERDFLQKADYAGNSDTALGTFSKDAVLEVQKSSRFEVSNESGKTSQDTVENHEDSRCTRVMNESFDQRERDADEAGAKEASELEEREISEAGHFVQSACQEYVIPIDVQSDSKAVDSDGNAANVHCNEINHAQKLSNENVFETADLVQNGVEGNEFNIKMEAFEAHHCDDKAACTGSSENRRQTENEEIVEEKLSFDPKIHRCLVQKSRENSKSIKEADVAFEREVEIDDVKMVNKQRTMEEDPEEVDLLASHSTTNQVSMETRKELKTVQNMQHSEDYLGKAGAVEEKEIRETKQKGLKEKDDSRKTEANKRERERNTDRIAVERAIREARERAFAEARERAERAAVERAAAEVRQRAMAEAREKLEKATGGSKLADKASIEAKVRAERVAVERATAEARERALEKALSHKSTAEARAQAEKLSASRDNGLKHSFSSSDLESLDGTSNESAQRRKARLERHQRIMERAAKALAEKNMRDLQAQKEQAERNRLAESLDADIKRWARGKEGNLRALISTLQYILGPNSGWQPISLTEIITTAAVKKAYRKATLYVHPDKLQQRGASIDQKYICEKVFDLLKAAWNRFNSEER